MEKQTKDLLKLGVGILLYTSQTSNKVYREHTEPILGPAGAKAWHAVGAIVGPFFVYDALTSMGLPRDAALGVVASSVGLFEYVKAKRSHSNIPPPIANVPPPISIKTTGEFAVGWGHDRTGHQAEVIHVPCDPSVGCFQDS